MALIFHMCRRTEWDQALARGTYLGSSQDQADGFIHFSTTAQIVESARKHRAGQTDLVVLAVKAEVLGDALKWESSRSGALFPHLYGPLQVSAVLWARPLPLGDDGIHLMPPLN